MRLASFIFFGMLFVSQSANAQKVVETIIGPSDTPNYSALAPYWLKSPTIEVIGRSEMEFEANTAVAVFRVTEIDRDSDSALLKVSNRTKPIIDKLVQEFKSKIKINATYYREVIYQQYRDKEGNLINYDREDKVDNYVVGWTIRIETSEPIIMAKIRSEILAIEKSRQIGETDYKLNATPDQHRQVFAAAIEDGKARAKLVADAHGTKLKLLTIQESRNECLSSPSGFGKTGSNSDSKAYAENIIITGSRIKARPVDLMLPETPRPEKLQAIVCMIYGLEK